MTNLAVDQLPNSPTPKNQAPPTILVVMLLVLVATSAYLFYQNTLLRQQLSQLTQIKSNLPTPENKTTNYLNTYVSQNGTFSFKYPTDLYIPPDRPEDHLLLFSHNYQDFIFNLGVSIQDEATAKSEDYKFSDQYISPQGLVWEISEIVPIEAAYNFDARTTHANRSYHFGIQANAEGLRKYFNTDFSTDLEFITTFQPIAQNFLTNFQFLNQIQLTDASQWPVYSNQSAKFSISYPPNFEFTEISFNGNWVVFSGAEGQIKINYESPSYSGWGGGCDDQYRGTIKFLGENKPVCTYPTGFTLLYADHPDRLSRVNISGLYTQPKNQSEIIINLILSTFKFTQ